MKTRSGFVSNSSSSSFIIAVLRRVEAASLIMTAADQGYGSNLDVFDKDALIARVVAGYDTMFVDEITKKLYGLNDSEYEFFYGDVGYHDDVLRYILKDAGVAVKINLEGD